MRHGWAMSVLFREVVASLLLCVSSVARPALAQPPLQIRPLFSLAQVYDNNVFFRTVDRHPDFVTRATPGIESRYESRLIRLGNRYSAGVERFAAFPELTGIVDHQASIDLRYMPSPRLALATDAAFAKTERPGELNVGSMLLSTRARAEQLTLRTSADRQLDRVTRLKAEYGFIEDGVAGGVRRHSDRAAVQVARNGSALAVTTFGYAVERFAFNDGTRSASHVLTAGWTREMTRATSFRLHGGPRFTGTRLSAEVAGSVEAHSRHGEISVAYVRTQTTLIGLPGLTHTQSMAVSIGALLPRLQVRITPDVARIIHRGVEAWVYRAGLEGLHPITRSFSLRAAYEASFQNGDIYATIDAPSIARHLISIGVVNTAGIRRRL